MGQKRGDVQRCGGALIWQRDCLEARAQGIRGWRDVIRGHDGADLGVAVRGKYCLYDRCGRSDRLPWDVYLVRGCRPGDDRNCTSCDGAQAAWQRPPRSAGYYVFRAT